MVMGGSFKGRSRSRRRRHVPTAPGARCHPAAAAIGGNDIVMVL